VKQAYKSAAAVCCIALLGWPSSGHRPAVGLDPSWKLGATFTHVQGLTYGDDIVFNYGPLGFVSAPMVGGGRWFLLGIVGLAALAGIIAVSLFGSLRL
jgi:hypothetical protein